jgi:predicted enzyme involved in methoxymalonyl-ACP biosynthesis
VEKFLFEEVIEIGKSLELTSVKGKIDKTERNQLVQDLYERLGFDHKSSSIYEYNLNSHQRHEYYITKHI